MKVIAAGLPKTGTKTLAKALTQLGYSVYDYEEHVYLLGDEWTKILTTGGTVGDFRNMYHDVDAVTDLPASYFWEEILGAFPGSKIIFTQRESEDVWLQSLKTQLEEVSTYWLSSYLFCLSPTKNRIHRIGALLCRTIYGSPLYDPWPFNYHFNKTVLRKVYRMHNAHVLRCAPKDKLLVYDVRQGWGPLCAFLGKKVPDVPFPHENIGGQILNEMIRSSPMLQKMKREMIVALLTILTGTVCALSLFTSLYL